MPRRGLRAVRNLVAASAITVTAFAAMVGYAALSFLESGRIAVVAATNALPRTARLSEARSGLRRLNAAMDAALLDKMRGRPFESRSLDEARGTLRGSLLVDDAAAPYPGELAKFASINDAFRRLDQATVTMVALLKAGTMTAAHLFENREWRLATDALDEAIESTVIFDIGQLTDHVRRLRQIANDRLLILVLAGLMSSSLAAVATTVAVRSIRLDEARLVERAHEWELFSARAAHDLLSPLQAVGLGLDFARRRSQDEQIVKAGTLGLSALERMRATANALLEFARSGGRPVAGGRAQPREVLAALLDELRPEAIEKRVELTHGPLPDAPVACPPPILGTLLSNLVRNALKFMGDRPERRVDIQVALEGRRARFEVRDTGPGLAPTLGGHLFEPFARGAGGGVPGYGLGLATVKRLAEAYGGEVGARSRRQAGAVFWVCLPLADGRDGRFRGRPPSKRLSSRPEASMYPTRNDLSETTRVKMIELLNARLADAVDLTTQLKQAHWNVKGPTFIALHQLFDEIVEDAEDYVDGLAERAVQLGGTADGTARSVARRSTLAEYPAASTGAEHVEAVAKALAAFGTHVRAAIAAAAKLDDADTADLFTEISRGADKWLWMVEAHAQTK
ncbi:MAG: DNA starvation/stationary phase protection protein Dps [Myxococcales bacterium]